MSKSGRSYSDPSYGSEKVITAPATGSLAGTGAIATYHIHQFMAPATVTAANLFYVAGGTGAAQTVLIGKSLAGTGTVTSIATIVTGTQATGSVKTATVTSTDFSTGDQLVFQKGGTAAIVTNVIAEVKYREHFEVGDN